MPDHVDVGNEVALRDFQLPETSPLGKLIVEKSAYGPYVHIDKSSKVSPLLTAAKREYENDQFAPGNTKMTVLTGAVFYDNGSIGLEEVTGGFQIGKDEKEGIKPSDIVPGTGILLRYKPDRAIAQIQEITTVEPTNFTQYLAEVSQVTQSNKEYVPEEDPASQPVQNRIITIDTLEQEGTNTKITSGAFSFDFEGTLTTAHGSAKVGDRLVLRLKDPTQPSLQKNNVKGIYMLGKTLVSR